MLVYKAFRFRLKPNGAQETLFRKTAGICRFVYNGALRQRQAHYRDDGETLWMGDQASRLVELKREPDMSWISDAPAQCLQQALVDLDTAFENFFEDLAKYKAGTIKARAIRRPRAHKKGKATDSFRFPQASQFVLDRKRVKLPKAGWVKFSASRKIEGTPKSITVSRDGKHWFMSVLCQVEQSDLRIPTGAPIGIDLNVEIGAAIALSDGTMLETPRVTARENKFRKKLHRILSRRKKGSQNWYKAKDRLAKFENYVANRRKDGLHKVTTRLAKNHSVIVIEDLKVKNMTASAKGTVENPGKKVKQKAGLNRAVLDRAFGMFRLFLTYKCVWYGADLRTVNPAYTSQRCSHCGRIHAASRNGALFECLFCGFVCSAHLNAALNILAEGLTPEELLIWGVKPQRSVDGFVSSSALAELAEAEIHRGASTCSV